MFDFFQSPFHLNIYLFSFFSSIVQSSCSFALFFHAKHVTSLIKPSPYPPPHHGLFQMNKSDRRNAITWANEWFLKDRTRPNIALRIKLIITADSKKKKKKWCGACVHFTETYISIYICYIYCRSQKKSRSVTTALWASSPLVQIFVIPIKLIETPKYTVIGRARGRKKRLQEGQKKH